MYPAWPGLDRCGDLLGWRLCQQAASSGLAGIQPLDAWPPGVSRRDGGPETGYQHRPLCLSRLVWRASGTLRPSLPPAADRGLAPTPPPTPLRRLTPLSTPGRRSALRVPEPTASDGCRLSPIAAAAVADAHSTAVPCDGRRMMLAQRSLGVWGRGERFELILAWMRLAEAAQKPCGAADRATLAVPVRGRRTPSWCPAANRVYRRMRVSVTFTEA